MTTPPSDASVLDGRFRIDAVQRAVAGRTHATGTDLRTGARVVIESAPEHAVSPGTLMRLEHARSAVGATPPATIAPVLGVGREGGAIHLVTALPPGRGLRERRGERLPLPEALRIGADVLTALAELHLRGVLHRDVTTSAVTLCGEGDDLRAVLTAAGLAPDAALLGPIADVPAEEVEHLAPEASGVLPGGVDERSDIYSAGTLVYALVSGRPPIAAPTAAALLRETLTATPPSLRTLVPHAPRALEEVLARLLRRDPRDRYQSARAAAADLTAIARGLARGEEDPEVVVGAHDTRSTLTEPAFVGRRIEFGALRAHVEDARRGAGGLVLLEAPSGGGKTRLLDELARHGAETGAWVLRGGGVDQAAARPFQLVDGVVREIVRAAEGDAELAAALRERLGDDARAARAAMPQLSPLVGALDDHGLGPEQHAEARGLRAMSGLLDAVGTPARPAIVILDDAQWADDLSLRLLVEWCHGREDDPVPVVVVAAFRTEEVGPEHPLRAIGPRDHLVLAPLGREEIGSLATTMAGALPPAALAAIGRLSGGNPFMATAALRGLVESAAIERHSEGWRIAAGALEDVSSSSEAADLLVRRMDLLPAPTLGLLTAGAVLGKDFDPLLAAELARQDPGDAVEALAEARRRHIVWAAPADERVTFVHDKLREALLSRAPDHEVAALHRAAARLIEGRDAGLSFELAYHYSAGGEHRLALPHALRAAAVARERHALGAAERHYRIAEAAGEALDEDAHRAIAGGLGEVLMLAGRYEEAQAHLERARDMAGDAPSRAAIDGRLGELAFKRGDVETACAAYERALRLLGHHVPGSTPALAVRALREVAVQAVHTVVPRRLGRRPVPDPDSPEMLAIRLYSRVAYPYWFGRGAVPTLWAHLRGMNLAERFGPTPELAQAYSEHAPVMTVLPWFGRAIRYAERSLAMRRGMGDVWGQGQSLHFFGVALYGASRYRECIERCEEAVRLLERTGDRWEMNTASWHVAMCDYRLGNLPEAARRAQEVHRQGREIGDAQAAGISLGIWAKATRGAVPAALIAAELARGEGDIHTRAELVMAEAIRLMRAGRPGPAARMLHGQLRIIERRGFRQEYVAPVAAWLATALRMRLEEAPALSRSRRLVVARRARRAARRAMWWARAYRNNLPHALREQALILALTGSGARADGLLERSAAEAERQGAAYELALTRRAQARLALEHGREDAQDDMRRAEDTLRGLLGESALDPRAPAALSLADRFDAVLSNGRRIASALDPGAVHDAVREAASALLRAERVAVTDVAALRAATEDDPDGATALERRLATRVPTVDAPPGGGSRLRVTILADGSPSAELAVQHDGVAGLFGPEEVRLAEYIAALAGAALENAATTAQLEHQAFHDPLTGLPNRALVRDRIDLALKRAARSGNPVSVLLLDLDDFKNVNDSLGHAAGDRLLTDAADRVRRVLRPADTPARLGGDEFAVLLEEADAATAARVASRVIEAFREPFLLDDREVFVSVTIGIASSAGVDTGADALLRDADAAMYAAKARGKRAFEIFVPEMRSAAVARLELGSSLRRALEQEEIELHYQPILDVATGDVVAVEALARWRHPELGVLGPADFIPLAEQSGLIEQIGAWVLRRACTDLAVLRAEPGARADLSVSVNLSPRQLRHHELADQVRSALRQAGVPPEALVLEITETAIAGDTPAGISLLRALRRIGVRVAVDDFGSGYSSLGQLRRLPVDLLKIDRVFLADAGSPEASSFLRAIVELARGLGLGVVAEGVESDEQLALVREVRCGLGQGWLWARAMPLDPLRAWLREEAAARERQGRP